jgi:hypothetical protein
LAEGRRPVSGQLSGLATRENDHGATRLRRPPELKDGKIAVESRGWEEGEEVEDELKSQAMTRMFSPSGLKRSSGELEPIIDGPEVACWEM